MSSLKATRMNLLITKRKLKLARRGHKLLKEKRDALVVEFFAVLKDVKELRQELGDNMLRAQEKFERAQAIQGSIDIERLALGAGPGAEIQLLQKNLMGIEIPSVGEIKSEQHWHGYFESTVELDEAIALYRELLPVFLKLVLRQLALNRLAEEIKKTKRKVNSLEYLIVPRLEYAKDFIAFKLEEFERENFIRLKMIKEKATREAA